MLGSGESAHWLLDRNQLALTARLALADEAAISLDIQYFVWQSDASGHLLADRILHAADRGVRVRILVDDFGVAGRGGDVLKLDAHPERRGTFLQSLGDTRQPLRHGGGVHGACAGVEPSHAQQDVHRRRPICRPGRPQRRRPLLRPLRAVRAERSRRHGCGADGARRCGDVRRILEQRARVPRDSAPARSAAAGSGGDHAAGAAREHRGERREALARSRSSPPTGRRIWKSSSPHSRRRGARSCGSRPTS